MLDIIPGSCPNKSRQIQYITLAGAPSTFRNGCADGWCAGVGVGVDFCSQCLRDYGSFGITYKIPLNGTNEMYAGQPLINGNSQPGYSDGISVCYSWFESPQDAAVDESVQMYLSGRYDSCKKNQQ